MLFFFFIHKLLYCNEFYSINRAFEKNTVNPTPIKCRHLSKALPLDVSAIKSTDKFISLETDTIKLVPQEWN